jgi:hypothetical protein
MRIVLGIVLFVATTALAQQSIKINEPVGRQLSSGSVQSETYQLLRMKSLSHFARRTGTAALSTARTRRQVALAMAFGCPSFNAAGR